MVSRLFKGAALVAATATFSTYAAAQFGSGTDFTAPAQSFGSGTGFVAPAQNFVPAAPVQSFSPAPTFTSPAPVQSFSSGTTFTGSSVSNTFAGVASSEYADAKYGTGSISNSYEGSDVEIFGFSGAPSSAPGLAANESLRPVDCPTAVYNPEGGKVLGCYDVVAPTPAPAPIPQTYYRVVRPVIYVRYPVYRHVAPQPVVPTCNPNVQPAWTSRYGANGFTAPKAKGCGW